MVNSDAEARKSMEAAIEKALGEPIGFDSSELANKVKRNLLLISIVVIALVVFEVKPSPNVSIFGVGLEGVSSHKLMVGLAAFLVYNFAHYIWLCYDLFGEWSVRSSGAKKGFAKRLKQENTDAEAFQDPKQLTLYSWWLIESSKLPTHEDNLQRAKKLADELLRSERILRETGDIPARLPHQNAEGHLVQTIERLQDQLSVIKSVVDNPALRVRLDRFDRRFKALINSQNRRILVYELIFPNALALYAFWLLFVFFKTAS